MKRLIVLVCLVMQLASGCSSSSQIAASSNDISGAAHSSRGRFVWIADEAVKPSPNMGGIHQTAKEGITEQETIIAATARIIYNLPGVRDVTPFWAELAVWAMVFLSLVGAVIIVLQTGVLQVVKSWVLALFVRKPAP